MLLTWNRYGSYDQEATKFEKSGGRVLVAENSPLGREWRGGYWYTICNGYHNATGHFPVGGSERWDSWGVELAPWRTDGEHILVLPQRGFGAGPYRQPDRWREQVLAWLSKHTKRPVRVREHPGTADPRPVDHGLLKDLAGAHCAVTWGSGAAAKALLAGIPTFSGCRDWMFRPSSAPWGEDLERPFLGDRLPAFRGVAWAIWNTEEISRGTPFKWLLAASTR